MSTFIKQPVVTIQGSITIAPTLVASLPWTGAGGGSTRPYKWSVTMGITAQLQSSVYSRQPQTYNGEDVNVGMWIANVATGQAWQIISVTSKSNTSVVCVVQDIFRYNTYRDSSKQGKGQPNTGTYLIFSLSEGGNPLIDPVPSTAAPSTNFFTNLASRFQYINNQYDFVLNQPGNIPVTFQYGDVIAVDPVNNNFVLADSTHLNVIGTVTGVDETNIYFTVNAVQKIVDNLNSLPGSVGSIIYSSTTTPGALTTTAGGTEVYVQLRTQTSSTTISSTFALPTTVVTTVGNTFNVNGVLSTVGGTATLTDVANAVNANSGTSGVTAVVTGTGPAYIQFTAVDARPINFADVTGSTTTNVGLISVENGIKAAGMYVTNIRQTTFDTVVGFTYTNTNPVLTTWPITHNGNTSNYICQVFDTTGAVVFPDTITTIDVNNVHITFASGQAGKAQFSLFVPQ